MIRSTASAPSSFPPVAKVCNCSWKPPPSRTLTMLTVSKRFPRTLQRAAWQTDALVRCVVLPTWCSRWRSAPVHTQTAHYCPCRTQREMRFLEALLSRHSSSPSSLENGAATLSAPPGGCETKELTSSSPSSQRTK